MAVTAFLEVTDSIALQAKQYRDNFTQLFHHRHTVSSPVEYFHTISTALHENGQFTSTALHAVLNKEFENISLAQYQPFINFFFGNHLLYHIIITTITLPERRTIL
jgi:hypothetical protein